MFFTELAVFVHLYTVCIVFLVFYRIVVSLFTFSASKRNLYSHNYRPPFNLKLRAVPALIQIKFIKLLNNCILQQFQCQGLCHYIFKVHLRAPVPARHPGLT